MAGEEHFVSGVAGRYATALFDLARDANTIDAVKADLERFDALVGESPDLARLVRSPVFSADEQLNALSAVLEHAGIGGLTAQFLKLVTKNRRLFAVHDMVRAFRNLVAHPDVTLENRGRGYEGIRRDCGIVTRHALIIFLIFRSRRRAACGPGSSGRSPGRRGRCRWRAARRRRPGSG